jgi:hypothetical protein
MAKAFALNCNLDWREALYEIAYLHTFRVRGSPDRDSRDRNKRSDVRGYGQC